MTSIDDAIQKIHERRSPTERRYLQTWLQEPLQIGNPSRCGSYWPIIFTTRRPIYRPRQRDEGERYADQVTPKVGLEVIGEVSRQRRSESELVDGLFLAGLDALSYANENPQDGALDAAPWIMK